MNLGSSRLNLEGFLALNRTQTSLRLRRFVLSVIRHPYFAHH
jgi:hypothetical protein